MKTLRTTLLSTLLLLMTGMVSAQEIEFSKKEIVDMTVEEAVNGSCTQNILTCLDISKATCKADVEKLLWGDCSKDIPATETDINKLTEYARQLVKCAVKGLFAKHNRNLLKNINSPACQSLQQ